MRSSSFYALLRGQWKTSRFQSPNRKIFGIKILLQIASLLSVFLASLIFEWTVSGVDGLLAGIAIFAGGFLAAFTHLASVRQTLDARHEAYGEAEAPERDLVDVAVTRLLSATMISGLTAAMLVLGRNVSTNSTEDVTGVLAALTWTGSAYTLLLFLATIPTLYSAYLQMNIVRPKLDGSDASKEELNDEVTFGDDDLKSL